MVDALADARPVPFWLDSGDDPTATDRLTGPTTADLLIVGGGFTGLWAAIHAKQRAPERDVVLIEAETVAHGASGRNGGIVAASLVHGLRVGQRLFPDELSRLEDLGKANIRGLRDTIERHGIDAEAEWSGKLIVAARPEDVDGLKVEYDLCRRYGYDAELLDATGLRSQLDSPYYHGGVWVRSDAGVVNPAKLAWGLKRVAIELGTRIYEHSPMVRLDADSTTLEVTTRDGSIRCPKVLLATNAYAAGDKRIRRRVVAIRDRVVATEPLSPEQLGRIGWRGRQGLNDTRVQLNYGQLTADRRIVFGGRVGYFFGDDTDPRIDRTPAPYRGLVAAFFETFPQLEDVRFTHMWSGPIALTARLGAHFQRYHDDRVVWAGGYSGFGVGASRFVARVGLDILDDPASPLLDLELVRTQPASLPPEPFRWLGAQVTMRALDAGDDPPPWAAAWFKLMDRFGLHLS